MPANEEDREWDPAPFMKRADEGPGEELRAVPEADLNDMDPVDDSGVLGKSGLRLGRRDLRGTVPGRLNNPGGGEE